VARAGGATDEEHQKGPARASTGFNRRDYSCKTWTGVALARTGWELEYAGIWIGGKGSAGPTLGKRTRTIRMDRPRGTDPKACSWPNVQDQDNDVETFGSLRAAHL
jgi:hypothetical protein